MSAEHLTQMLAERKAAHGDFKVQFVIAQKLKDTARDMGLAGLDEPVQIEAVEMILMKISRIIAGHSGAVDHWDDIAGYATLIANMLRPAEKTIVWNPAGGHAEASAVSERWSWLRHQ